MTLKNFDNVKREKREIQVGGEIADVSRIPSRVTIELMEAAENGKIDENNPNSFNYTLDLVEKVLTNSNEKIDRNFLLDNTDFETLIEIVEYVMEPLNNKTEQVQSKNKKAQAATKEKTKK